MPEATMCRYTCYGNDIILENNIDIMHGEISTSCGSSYVPQRLVAE